MLRFPVLLAAVWVAACSTLPVSTGLPAREAIRDFSIEARFALSQDQQRHSGRLSWQHAGDRDVLVVTSPFGQTMAEISVVPGKARLETAERNVHEAADAATLTREVLGYALPIASLADWLLGRGGEIVRDEVGRPAYLSTADWEIRYEYDEPGASALPARLQAARVGGPEIRLRIEEWKALP